MIVLQNDSLTNDIYKLVLQGDTAKITTPGQFVNIKIDGFFLRRPISVCDCQGDTLTLIYKVVGAGTKKLSLYKAGDSLDILTGLGNGYTIMHDKKTSLLIGGGVGIPPLYMLGRLLRQNNIPFTVVLGFNTLNDVFYSEEFKSLTDHVYISTADGSLGTKGFVTDVIKQQKLNADYYYTCGPYAMLKAVYDTLPCGGQLSFEERMACGFGACMGCSCKTKYGNKRICTDGPVLSSEEVVW